MVTRYVKGLLVMIASIWMAKLGANPSQNLGNALKLQQEKEALKLALEHARLQNELDTITAQSTSVSKLCSVDGIGMLHLKLIYGVDDHLYASFMYNNTTSAEAKVGGSLLCGEVVKKISLDYVELQKGNKIYRVAGELSSIPLFNDAPSSHKQPLIFE